MSYHIISYLSYNISYHIIHHIIYGKHYIISCYIMLYCSILYDTIPGGTLVRLVRLGGDGRRVQGAYLSLSLSLSLPLSLSIYIYIYNVYIYIYT